MEKTFALIFIFLLIAYFLILIFGSGLHKKGKLKKAIQKRISGHVSDLYYLNSELSIRSKGSFLYAKIELAYAITELKVEINKVFLRTVEKMEG